MRYSLIMRTEKRNENNNQVYPAPCSSTALSRAFQAVGCGDFTIIDRKTESHSGQGMVLSGKLSKGIVLLVLQHFSKRYSLSMVIFNYV